MSETPPTDPHFAYFQALGFFVHRFAETEKLLALALWQLSGISVEKARAVFSGVRVDGATSFITRLLVATNAPQDVRDEHQYLFTQLGHITKLRNSILHYGTEFAGDAFVTSNRFVAITPDRIEERPASAEVLWAAQYDLGRINWRLGAEMSRGSGTPRHFFTEVANWNEPWRYTPPSPTSRRDSSRAMTPAPQPPPEPSRG